MGSKPSVSQINKIQTQSSEPAQRRAKTTKPIKEETQRVISPRLKTNTNEIRKKTCTQEENEKLGSCL